MVYRRNSEVEIYGEDDGFTDTYFEATIINRVHPGLYRVRYKELLNDDEDGPLVEDIWENRIRPIPPRVIVPDFRVRDKVDAKYNDGWWIGVVSSVNLPTYQVRFKHFEEESSYSFNELRIHQTKIGVTWNYRREPMEFYPNSDVEISGGPTDLQDNFWPANVVHYISSGMFRVRYEEQYNANGQRAEEDMWVGRIRPVPYDIIIYQFAVDDVVDVMHDNVWFKGVITSINGDGYGIREDGIPYEMYRTSNQIRMHQIKNGSKWSYVKNYGEFGGYVKPKMFEY